mgnify:CR=1 FL=1
MPSEPYDMQTALEERGVDFAKIAKGVQQVDIYSSVPAGEEDPSIMLDDLIRRSKTTLPAGMDETTVMYQGIPVVKLSDYNKYLAFRGFDQLHLADDQYLITCDMGDTLDDMFNSILSAGTTITLGGKTLVPGADKVDPQAGAFRNSAMGLNSGTVVLPDAVVDSDGICPAEQLAAGQLQGWDRCPEDRCRVCRFVLHEWHWNGYRCKYFPGRWFQYWLLGRVDQSQRDDRANRWHERHD